MGAAACASPADRICRRIYDECGVYLTQKGIPLSREQCLAEMSDASDDQADCVELVSCQLGGYLFCFNPMPQPDAGAPDRKVSTKDQLAMASKEGPVYLDGAMVSTAGNCLDASSEPNNHAGTATALPAKAAIMPGWEICYPHDVDQFAVKLTQGQALTVKVKFKHSKGDLEAALVDPAGFVVSASRSETDNEQVTVTAAKAGKYIIGVWGFAKATNVYDLELSLQ